MKADEETIQATLDGSGQLQLNHVPHLPPGPVSVTIRTSVSAVRRRRTRRRGPGNCSRATFPRFSGPIGRRIAQSRTRRGRPTTPIAIKN